jgi:flagellar hook-length control protein FliK
MTAVPSDGDETIIVAAGGSRPSAGVAKPSASGQPLAAPDTDTAAPQADTADAPAATNNKPAAQATTEANRLASTLANKSADPSPAPQEAATAKPLDMPAPQGLSHAAPAAHHASAASAPQAATNPVPAPTPVPIAGLAVEIAARASAGKNRFEIRLDPPELGRIDVRLDIDKHGHVTSRLIVEKAETLDLLRRDAPHLERALQDAGLKTSGDGLQFSLQQQTPQERNDDDTPARTAEITVTDDMIDTNLVQRGYARLAAARGGVDIRI